MVLEILMGMPLTAISQEGEDYSHLISNDVDPTKLKKIQQVQRQCIRMAGEIVKAIPEEYRREFRLRSIDFETILQVAASLRDVTDHEIIDYQEVTDQLKLYVTTGHSEA